MCCGSSVFFQLIYRSVATVEFWPNDLFDLVEKSRKKNSDRSITGMLLFHKGDFLQLLEGPEKAVRDCFSMVGQDHRHRAVEVLFTGTVPGRDFPDWTMGFESREEAWNLPKGWSTFLETEKNSTAVRKLLLGFLHKFDGANVA
jgi:hypothetical protein